MPSMELAQTKIPYLPPDWTAERVTKLAVKLGAFILVPGVHQVTCNRKILGCLLFLLYAVSEFVLSNAPIGGISSYSPSFTYLFPVFWNLSDVAQYTSWILLAIDLRSSVQRQLNFGSMLLLPCFAIIFFAPLENNRLLNFHIEQENIVCPEFCENDIVEWQFHDSKVHKLLPGDYVVLKIHSTSYYTTRILEGPVRG